MQQERGLRVSGLKRLLIAVTLLSGCAPEEAPPEPAAVPAAVPAAAPVVVNVPEIAGKSEAEVAQILGEPTERSTTKNDGKTYPDLFYQNGKVEVVYVDGKAEWISVMDLQTLPFGTEALPALGITDAGEPSFANRHVIRWQGRQYPPLEGVHLFPDQGGQLGHAYIQVTRRP